MTKSELVNIIDALDVLAGQTVAGEWSNFGWGSIDDIFHSLFDDFDRRSELRDLHLDDAYQALDAIFKEIGDRPGAEFTTHVKWAGVVESARLASASLRKHPLMR